MVRTAPLPRGITLFRGRYRVRLTVEGSTHAIGMFDTLVDAKAALAIAHGEKARGTFVPPSAARAQRKASAEREQVESAMVGDWAETWLGELEANPRRSRSTVVSYRSVLRNHVLPTLGEVRLVDLTTQMVADLLTKLRAKPSARFPGAKANGVTHTTTIVLRSMINSAVRTSCTTLGRSVRTKWRGDERGFESARSGRPESRRGNDDSLRVAEPKRLPQSPHSRATLARAVAVTFRRVRVDVAALGCGAPRGVAVRRTRNAGRRPTVRSRLKSWSSV
ncbi:hypothetical protein [Occultella kanbiaonis]|uniref:hypothetical protein n=1 Tax=Occultella kanbiaonis TaxID=2675754 RepID=UPI0013D21F8A|nr:hypothetical protein [Occultella kanbiaonis]